MQGREERFRERGVRVVRRDERERRERLKRRGGRAGGSDWGSLVLGICHAQLPLHNAAGARPLPRTAARQAAREAAGHGPDSLRSDAGAAGARAGGGGADTSSHLSNYPRRTHATHRWALRMVLRTVCHQRGSSSKALSEVGAAASSPPSSGCCSPW